MSAYLACARKLLAAPDAVFPQFATHNAHTLAAIDGDGGRDFTPATTSSSACTAWASRSTRRSSDRSKLDRPCRIYAPVGTHETLLAYLVRRLLENGANTSFVNRSPIRRHRSTSWSPIPVAAAARRHAARRAASAASRCRGRCSARRGRIRAGVDLSNEQRLASLSRCPAALGAERGVHAGPTGRRRGAARCAIRPTGATSSAM